MAISLGAYRARELTMRRDSAGLSDLTIDQRCEVWQDLPYLDKYVLQFVRKRFDQQARSRDGHLFRLVYDGRSIRLPFAVELDNSSRKKLDGCEGVITDLDGQNALYYDDLYKLEMSWFMLTQDELAGISLEPSL
jgi:hypothetical protein